MTGCGSSSASRTHGLPRIRRATSARLLATPPTTSVSVARPFRSAAATSSSPICRPRSTAETSPQSPRVGPPAGHPLRGIERDAGVSTELRDYDVLALRRLRRMAARRRVPLLRQQHRSGLDPHRPRRDTRRCDRRQQACHLRDPGRARHHAVPVGLHQIMWPLSATSVPDGTSSRDRVIAVLRQRVPPRDGAPQRWRGGRRVDLYRGLRRHRPRGPHHHGTGARAEHVPRRRRVRHRVADRRRPALRLRVRPTRRRADRDPVARRPGVLGLHGRQGRPRFGSPTGPPGATGTAERTTPRKSSWSAFPATPRSWTSPASSATSSCR